jgi:hypothetical protein
MMVRYLVENQIVHPRPVQFTLPGIRIGDNPPALRARPPEGDASDMENQVVAWQGQPISGVFSARTTVRGAAEVRDRVHFLGFVRERIYKPDEFGAVLALVANPYLFPDAAAVRAAGATWPLQPVRILNAAD